MSEGIGTLASPEDLARLFHEAYEELAPRFSYATRQESAVAWENVPENNRKLMIATAERVLEQLFPIQRGGPGDHAANNRALGIR